MSERAQKAFKIFTNLLTVVVLVAFIILSLIIQVRDAAMDSISIREREELRERLDRADREREELRRELRRQKDEERGRSFR